jgi:hypothetical protein
MSLSSQKYGLGIRDPRSGIRDVRSGIRDPGSEIRDPRSGIRDPGSEIRDPRSGIRDPGSEIRDPEKTYSGSRIQGSKRHWIPDPGSATLVTRWDIHWSLYPTNQKTCTAQCWASSTLLQGEISIGQCTEPTRRPAHCTAPFVESSTLLQGEIFIGHCIQPSKRHSHQSLATAGNQVRTPCYTVRYPITNVQYLINQRSSHQIKSMATAGYGVRVPCYKVRYSTVSVSM